MVNEPAALPWSTGMPLDADDLADVLARPAWHEDAACRGSMIDFFPDRGATAPAAVAVCQGCPVRTECRSWALDQPVTLVGVWAATTQHDRVKLKRVKRT